MSNSLSSLRAKMRDPAFRPVLVVVGIFFISRFVILACLDKDPQDVMLYAQYAWEDAQVRHYPQAANIYEVHPLIIDQLNESGRVFGEENKAIEYPPLAVTFICAIRYGIPDNITSERFKYQYVRRFRSVLFVCDILLMLLVLAVSPRLSTAAAYTGLGGLLAPVLYNRLDLVLALLIFASFYGLIRGRNHLSYALLAAGVAFKLVPLFLVPLWIAYGVRESFDIKGVLRRGMLMGFYVLLLSLPFVIAYGKDPFLFFGYHGLRGIQIESMYSSVLMLASLVGADFAVVHQFGALEVKSALSPILARLSAVFMAGGTLWIAWVYLQKKRKGAVAVYVLLTLLLIICTSKVFSPQYLLWCLPFISVVCHDSSRHLIGALVVLFLVTTIVYPILYFKHIFIASPTVLGKALIIARNACAIAVSIAFYRETDP
jgi:hypothetical protein